MSESKQREERRCGTCRWWDRSSSFRTNVTMRKCVVPIPFWVEIVNETGGDSCPVTRAQDGTDCPTYEKRES